MAATITDVVQIGPLAWKYYATGATEYVWMRDGFVAQTGEADTFIAEWYTDSAENRAEAPAVEVADIDDGTAALTQSLYPPLITLQFRGRATNAYYLIEFSVDNGSNWETGGTQREDGSGYYQFKAPALPAIDILFRVTPYDSTGTAGVPLEYSVFHYAAPTPPILQFNYNSTTHNVTVDAL